MKKILFFVLVGIFLLTACGNSSNSSDTGTNAPIATVPAEYAGKVNPLRAEAATDGAKVFKSNCEACHGVQGHGDGPVAGSLNPPPKNLAVFQESVADDYLFWRITEGKPGTSMVAWKGILTEEQIWQVVSFVRQLPE